MSRESNADGPRDSRRDLVVVPGEDLGVSEGYEAGHGVLVVDGRLKSTKQGRMNTKGSTVSVEPLHTTYMPRPGDLVIGHIEGCTNNIWFVDIGAPFNSILPMSLGPAKVEFGGTRKVLDIGDSILCRVQEVEETHQSVVTMKGLGLRKIRSGALDDVDPHLLGRLIGKGGNFLRDLKLESECRIVVAENGRLWIDGGLEGILKVRKSLKELSHEARQVGGVN
ncbi:MAG: KH domain-containing protein [Candidatus Thermoplasmatota archaeon]|jgi:exosome complex component RRP4|nr:KH domain-containing protein [Candidatus Thermoplasmatota archaeon]|tara:strand:- start:419 stop:1087 length:669 start_codon:yes stop_codon:yes gene_type:complete